MCGIIGYTGTKEAYPILLAGLEKLEYRGDDSAGICTAHNNTLHLHKASGRVHTLNTTFLPGNRGIAHTRWATHGGVVEKNAHPHTDCKQEIFVVHNGIVENFEEIKKDLIKKGHRFKSETDTEVIAHLLEGKNVPLLYDRTKVVHEVFNSLKGLNAIIVFIPKTQKFFAIKNSRTGGH